MIAPVPRLKKSELVWLYNHRCKKHRHRFLNHYTCYLRENPQSLKIGFLDTENTALDAEWGIMLCYCIKVLGKNEIIEGLITKEDLCSEHEDREVVRKCVKDIQRFDRLIGYYSTCYDLPFIRSRALINKIEFPSFGSINHEDVYYIIKNKFKLKRNRQENACRSLLGRTLKTHIRPKIWRKAAQGDREALEWVRDHCRRDVRDLERLFNRVCIFKKRTDKSI